MNKKRIKSALSLLLALLLTAGLVLPAAAAERSTIYIRTADDLVALARHCSLDTWSQDKTVILQRDISLSGVEFSTIATFGGVFDGGDHTISGWTLTEPCAPAGFFSVLQSGGRVKNLKLEGSVSPGGEAEAVGGIAGENAGTITGCTFTGTVSGKKATGGIAGRSTLSGTISGCSVSGGVFGERMTGGIVGENHGSVANCVGNAYVNTEYVDPGISLGALDFDFGAGLGALGSQDIYSASTDSGGIAGYSDGMLLGCTNQGSVGYQHLGYNVGGVAGRNRGFISACVNHGEICGRREVGGVVGQAEPYVVAEISGSSLESIRAQMHILSNLLDRAAQDAESASAAISNTLTNINNSVAVAADDVDLLGKAMTGYWDETLSEINRGGEIVEHVLGQISTIADQLPAISAKIESALSHTVAAVGFLRQAIAADSGAAQDLDLAANDLEQALRLLNTGIEQLSLGLECLGNAVVTDEHGVHSVDWTAVEQGLDYIAGGLELMAGGDTQSGNQGVAMLVDSAVNHLNDALDKEQNSADLAAQNVEKALLEMRKAVEALQNVVGNVTDVLVDLDALTDYLDSVDPLKFQKLESRTGEITKHLHSTVAGLGNQLENLNQDLSSASSLLISDLRAVNEQFTLVMDLLLDEATDIEAGVSGGRVTDTSDEDIDAVTDGKILRCSNSGSVYGDYDVGGIAGSMGIYNELDPEGDASHSVSSTLRRHYELKAILQGCSNTGSVSAKQSYCGGIVGLAKLGVITECKAYGEILSENGDYVGGIVGGNDTIVRRCYAKCSLSGEKYIGGILGSAIEENGKISGSTVSDCAALVEIRNYSQYAGAIAGRNLGEFSGNYFVSEELAGIDRMSYGGQAEPLSYPELLEIDGLPGAFRRFELSFFANGKLLKSLSFDYGDSFDASVYPDIPTQQGQYGKWDREELKDLRFDTVVTAQYDQYISALPSSAKRADGRVIFLVEGSFDDGDYLEASPAMGNFEAAERGVWETLRFYRREIMEQWQISYPVTGTNTNTVRYLPPDGKTDHLHVYLPGEDGWLETDCSTAGSYLLFEVPDGGSSVAILRESSMWWIWMLFAAFLLVMLLLILRYQVSRKAYLRAANYVAQHGAAAAPVRRKWTKLRYLLLALLILLLLFSATVAAIVHFVPGVKNSVELYSTLAGYELKDELDMQLDLQYTVGERSYAGKLPLYTTMYEGKRVSCVNISELPVYFCDGHMILENGAVYTASNTAMPDATSLLHEAAALFSKLNISATEDGADRSYHVTVSGDESAEVLTLLLPQLGDIPAESTDMSVDLVTKDGTIARIRFAWSGALENAAATPVTMEASLRLDVAQKGSHLLPAEVCKAITGGFEQAQDLTDDVHALLRALTDVGAREPLSADIHLSANCGPLLLNDDIHFVRSMQSGKAVTALSKGKLALYFADDTICTAEGLAATPEQMSQFAGQDLLPVLFQAALSGEMRSVETAEKRSYILSLGEQEMSKIISAIAPEAKALDLFISTGTLKLDLEADRLQSLTVQCSCTLKLALAEIPATFGAKVTFPTEQEIFSLPEPVQEALFPVEK